jgi:hypothetical protein
MLSRQIINYVMFVRGGSQLTNIANIANNSGATGVLGRAFIEYCYFMTVTDKITRQSTANKPRAPDDKQFH